MATATWRGRAVARSDRAREVGGYCYFPREHVQMQLLEPAARTPRDLECPHGVHFYDLVDGADRSERAAWSYESPQPALEDIDHWIGFWEDVQVEV